MKVAPLALATSLVVGIAAAQTPPPTDTTSPSATVTPTPPPSHNPAVATQSNANDQAAPAHGSNSFTENQAKSRIADRGYASVGNLQKDDQGVWRGTAQQNGQPVHVWLDYKGNVGEEQ